ncbi:MAG: hypothetical protein ACXWE9_00955 [Methylobacter sp.]
METFEAKAAPAANTYTSLGPVPCDMTINIRCVNHDVENPIKIRLAISAADVAPGMPPDTDWIEPKDKKIGPGGLLEDTGIRVKSGSVVTVYNNAATATWRVYGV